MSKTERSGHTTTNHEFIKQWVTERGGHPACVRGTGEDEIGVLRIEKLLALARRAQLDRHDQIVADHQRREIDPAPRRRP